MGHLENQEDHVSLKGLVENAMEFQSNVPEETIFQPNVDLHVKIQAAIARLSVLLLVMKVDLAK